MRSQLAQYFGHNGNKWLMGRSLMTDKKKDVLREFLKKGSMPIKPFVFPVIFSISAEVEGMSAPPFLLDATKVSNALRRIYQYHSYDCILCYFCNSLEEEIIGAEVDRSVFPPIVSDLDGNLLSVESFDPDDLKYGRIVKDVIQRLKITVGDRQLLASGFLGPIKLGRRVTENISYTDLEVIASAIQKLAQWFCQSGVDMIIFVEDIPFGKGELFEEWEWNFSQIVKLVIFHEALPVLMIKVADKVEHVKTLLQRVEGLLPCFVCDDIEKFSRALKEIQLESPFGLAFSLELLSSGNTMELRRMIKQYKDRIMLLTTSEEIAFGVHKAKDLQAISDSLNQIMG